MECTTCGVSIVTIDCTVDPRTVSHHLTAQCGHEVVPTHARVLWAQGMRWTLPVVDGSSLLSAERYRQQHEEGFTAAHDAALDANDLTWAAWCLLDAAASDGPTPEAPKMWPEGAGEWKPDHSDLRRLVIAGALVIAEIDRLLLEGRNGHGA